MDGSRRKKDSEWRYGKLSSRVFGVFGVITGWLGAYALSVGGWKLFILVLASLFIVAHVVDYYIKTSIRKRGEVELDEMFVRISWMSGHRALEVSCITIALILTVTLSLEYLNIHVLPYDLTEKLYPGLFASLNILVLTYVAFYIYYALSRKVIE